MNQLSVDSRPLWDTSTPISKGLSPSTEGGIRRHTLPKSKGSHSGPPGPDLGGGLGGQSGLLVVGRWRRIHGIRPLKLYGVSVLQYLYSGTTKCTLPVVQVCRPHVSLLLLVVY